MGEAREAGLIVVGAGGFGQEAVWVARRMGRVSLLGFADDRPELAQQEHAGLTVLGTPEQIDEHYETKPYFYCAIGDNRNRERMVDRLRALGWQAMSLIDPSALVAEDVKMGEGVYLGAGCIVAPNVRMGAFAILNFHTSIGHNSILGAFSQVSPGGRISGNVTLGDFTYVGSNAIVHPGRSVGAGASVGAGSYALRNVPDGATVMGNPARTLPSA